MKYVILFISLFLFTSCGSHKSTNDGFTQNGGGFDGLKDETFLGQVKTAMDEQEFEAFTSLIQQSADVNMRLPNTKNATPLIYAAYKNLPKFALFLLNNKADVLLADEDAKTAIDHARTNSARALLLLDPEEQKLKGAELMNLIEAKRDSKVYELLNSGVDPNFIDATSGETPLTKAILSIGQKIGATPAAQEKSVKKSIKIAKFLLEWKDSELGVTSIDINRPNQSGLTPLGFAISKDNQDNKEVIDLLKNLNAKETL